MLLYEGKAKQVYSTENENEYVVYYKDDATAFNGEKKASIASKGILNNKICTINGNNNEISSIDYESESYITNSILEFENCNIKFLQKNIFCSF